MKSSFDSQAETLVREIASRLADSSGFELVLVELIRGGGRPTIRLTIDRDGGVTLDDCAGFSRNVGAALEVEDPFPGSYCLEVSSPGLDRRLVRAADYERFRGRLAKIVLRTPIDGRRNFQGILKGLDGEAALVELEGGVVSRLPLHQVEVARLVPEF